MLTADAFSPIKRDLTAEMLCSYGQCRLQVSGVSMLPTLWPGETVLIENRPLARVTVGDIVMYRRDGRFILHRLTSLPTNPAGIVLILKGDFVPCDDPPVPAECYLGVLAGVRRGRAWVRISPQISTGSRWGAALLRRSSWLVRALLSIRSWRKSAIPRDAAAEASSA